MKHAPAPGPWHLGEKHLGSVDGYPINKYPISAKGQAIAAVYAGYNTTFGNELANARLIAAAPELLKALQKMLDAFGKAEIDAVVYAQETIRIAEEGYRDERS